jgi:undecaprenyl-diphosphatase
LWGAAVVLTSLAGHALKLLVERSRPSTALLAGEADYSFPSGHATGATALALATVLLIALVAPVRGRRAATVALAAYAAIICASRLALGVHYLTDIVSAVLFATAGVLAMGAAWPARAIGFSTDGGGTTI